MSAMGNSIVLGAIQILVVLSLSGKLLYDRATKPRAWALTQGYDPELPIRGRYLTQRLRLPVEGLEYKPAKNGQGSDWFVNRNWAHFEVRNRMLIAKPAGEGNGGWIYLQKRADGSVEAVSEEPVLVFIPDTAVVPILKPGEEMWVEVTVPAKGPPRPIRLAVKRNGTIEPLKLE
jgi:hypothetical protein